MIYAMSDLHGCYNKYIKMLDKINFSEKDTLYVLGDIVDRGNGGIDIIQDMIKRKNIIPIIGNHDSLAYRMLKYIHKKMDENNYIKFFSWILDGGAATYDAFMRLDTERQNKILSYINSFLIYDEIKIKEKTFFMSHTVPQKERMINFDKLLWQEFIVGEPDYEECYFEDKYIVTGHTPTGFIDPNCKGKIYKKNNHIAIDCGAVFGNPLGCICLDTLEEFYVEE